MVETAKSAIILTKNRRKIKERKLEESDQQFFDGRTQKQAQVHSGHKVYDKDIIDKYPYEELSIGNSEEYIKRLMFESLEFERPSRSKTPTNKLLKEARDSYRKREISKTTYNYIKETLTRDK